MHVHSGRRVLGELALQELSDPARELNYFESSGHFAGGVARNLAVLAGQNGRDLVDVSGEQFTQREQCSRALRQRRSTPGRKGRSSRGDRGVHFGVGGKVNFTGLHAGGRVEDLAVALRVTDPRLAVDPVGNSLHTRILVSALCPWTA